MLHVTEAIHIKEYTLKVKFSDGETKEVDFKPFIFKGLHVVYEKYKMIDEFLKFEIEDGYLHWNDFEMVFPAKDLYKNSLLENIENSAYRKTQ